MVLQVALDDIPLIIGDMEVIRETSSRKDNLFACALGLENGGTRVDCKTNNEYITEVCRDISIP